MTKTSIALWAVLFLAVLVAAFCWANRPRNLIIDAALPLSFPAQGFSHDSFETLLRSYVSADGRVDYDRWHQSQDATQQLNSYLAAVSQFSPNATPERFSTRNDELAYWMYAYNAYVIKSVLDHWPLESVTDVKAPLEVVKGLGFFYQQQFSFGGEYMNLLDVENKQIRKKYQDPRIHFFLNCASESCPVARPDLPVGEGLDQLLTQATVDFINDPENVAVDHDNKVVQLSTIFKWYENDFVNHVRLDSELVGNGLIAYVSLYASDELAAGLTQAGDYEVRFREYDWGLNATD
jgi:uncharacterized protein DUF547